MIDFINATRYVWLPLLFGVALYLAVREINDFFFPRRRRR